MDMYIAVLEILVISEIRKGGEILVKLSWSVYSP